MKEQTLELTLLQFKTWLESNGKFTTNVINSYASYVRQAFACDGALDKATIYSDDNLIKAKQNIDSLDKKKASNIRSAMKQFDEFILAQKAEEKQITPDGSIVLVKISRKSFKDYLTDVHRKEDGSRLSSNTINAFTSNLTRISKVNIYDTWHEVEPLYQALDKIIADTQFNAVDHGGCRAAIQIFINAIEDILAGKYKSTEVHILKLTGKEI